MAKTSGCVKVLTGTASVWDTKMLRGIPCNPLVKRILLDCALDLMARERRMRNKRLYNVPPVFNEDGTINF